MSRHYDDPPPPSPLECVRYVQETVFFPGGEAHKQKVLIFDFSKFTPAVMLGGNTKRWSRSALHGEDLYGKLQSVPLGNLARWIYQQKQTHWRDLGKADNGVAPLVEALVAGFERDGLNDDGMLDGIVAEHGYINARLPDDHPQGPGAPVMLRLLGEDLDDFFTWFKHEDKLLKQRKVDEECKAMLETLGRSVGRLRRVMAKRRRNHEKLAPTAAALKTGAAVLEMVELFARPASERPTMWKAIEREDWGKKFVDPLPDEAWRGRFRRFRNDWHRELVGRCAKAMRPESLQRKIDRAADDFVDELRVPDAPYLELLRSWDSLLPGSRAVLRTTLHEGFRLALLSLVARERLVAGELSKLAQMAASLPVPAVPPAASGSPLLDEIDAFDASVLEPDEETPFAQWMLETYSSAKDLAGHGTKMLDVLALGTPFISRRLETMTNGSKYLSAAWAWVALAGTCELTTRKAESFFDLSGVDLVDGAFFKRQEGESGAIKELVGSLDGVWQLANVLARTVHLRYALAEVESASTEELQLKRLEALQSFLSFSQMALELPGGENPARLILELGSGIEKINLPVAAGVLADAAGLAVAYTTYRRVQTKRRTRKVKEAAKLELAFEILAFTVGAIGAIGAIAGAEFVILGLVIAGTKAVVTDLDFWMPATEFWTGIQSKPGPHAYLEGVLAELYNSDAFHEAIKDLGSMEAVALSKSVERLGRGLEVAPRRDTQVVWDVGGRPESNLSYPARNIAEHYWGEVSSGTSVSRDVLAKVVMPCQH